MNPKPYKFAIGERVCSKCHRNKDSSSGTYEVFANGLRQRWLCKDCSLPKPIANE